MNSNANGTTRDEFDTYNPFKTSKPTEEIITNKFAGEALINYSKETGTEISLSNNINNSLRYSPFMEFMYPMGGNQFYVYNSDLIGNQCSTTSKDELVIPSDVQVNQKCRLMMDSHMICYYNDTQTNHDIYKYYPFTSNQSIMLECRYLAEVKSSPYGPYTENEIYRWDTFLYYPGSLVYLLISKDPYKIYIMQSFTNKKNTDIVTEQLVYLKNYITLPNNWTYGYMRLDFDTFLSVPSNGKALVATDDLYNAYMYIVPESAPWLYDKYQ